MKLLIIITFIFSSLCCFGQTDSVADGEILTETPKYQYKHEVQLGVYSGALIDVFGRIVSGSRGDSCCGNDKSRAPFHIKGDYFYNISKHWSFGASLDLGFVDKSEITTAVSPSVRLRWFNTPYFSMYSSSIVR